MADNMTTPGASPLSIIASLLGAGNDYRQKQQAQQAQQAGAFTPSGGAGAYGNSAPTWSPGGAGYGTYEGNIRTAANPSGAVTPNLGAANPPAASGVPMPRPRPLIANQQGFPGGTHNFGGPPGQHPQAPFPAGFGSGPNPWSQMPPRQVGQVGGGGVNPQLPWGATAPQPVQGATSLPFSPTYPSSVPYLGTPGRTWASGYMQPQGNPMMNALFSAPLVGGA